MGIDVLESHPPLFVLRQHIIEEGPRSALSCTHEISMGHPQCSIQWYSGIPSIQHELVFAAKGSFKDRDHLLARRIASDQTISDGITVRVKNNIATSNCILQYIRGTENGKELGESACKSAVLFAIVNIWSHVLDISWEIPGFLFCIMLIVDMQMSKNAELRVPNGWFFQSQCFSQCICTCVTNYLHLHFFSTFHLCGACTTFPGWWTGVLHWGNATVHATGISREFALWISLWKCLSIDLAHLSWHGSTAYPTAACPLCKLDLLRVNSARECLTQLKVLQGHFPALFHPRALSM